MDDPQAPAADAPNPGPGLPPLEIPAVGFPSDFAAEALYAPEAWFLHRLVHLDREAARVVAEMDTRQIGFLVDSQRQLGGHEQHVPAAVIIQATGTLGQLFAVYALDLRVTTGWHGYGTHIHKARFGRMGRIGPPVLASATCTRRRQLMGTLFCDFDIRFEQEGQLVYQSTQTAGWRRLG